MKRIFILLFIVCGYAHASVMHSLPVVCFLSISSILRIYQKERKSFPSGWGEFISSGYLSSEILEQAERYCDIENRYYFIQPDKLLWILGHAERIVVMAKYPGMEGDQIHPVNKNIIKGRWLIVEMANGDIQTRHYSEAVLNHLFVEADLKLADYTEDVPASAQEKYESILYGGRQEKSVKDRLLG